MSWRWLLILSSVMALLASGCPADDDDDAADDDATGDDDTTADDDDDTTDDDDDTEPEEPGLQGTVYAVDCETPLPGVRVTLCQDEEACAFLDTDENGQFLMDGLVHEKNGEFRAAGHINAEMRPFTGLIHEFDIPETGFYEIDDICLPEIPTVTQLSGGEQTVDAGDGLFLTFDPDAVTFVLDTPQLGAVQVPETAWQYARIEGVELLAAWAMYVWGSTCDEPVAAEMPMLGDVQCDDSVTIYQMSDADIGWVPVGDAVLDCDLQTVSTAPGEGLSTFTWVAYGRPE
jgi:hypothetical protein